MASPDRGSPSPRAPLARLRRHKGVPNDSTNSLSQVSTNDEDGDEKSRGLRGSIDDAIEKVKDRSRRADERRGSDESGGHRLSKLMTRMKRGSRQGDLDLERNVSADAGNGNGSLSIAGNKSDTSLMAGSVHSSNLTDEYSDGEGYRKPTRPTLSPHQSHTGYLTLSSPEINAQTVVPGSPLVTSPDAVPILDPLSSVPQIIHPDETHVDTEPIKTETLEKPALPPRSSSPAGRLKDAFSINRKKVGGGDSDSIKSSGSGGLGGLLRPRSRRGSVNPPVEGEAEKSDEKVAEDSAPDPDVSIPQSQTSAEQPQATETQQRPETPQHRGRSRINTNALPATPPNQIDTPTTLVTPPTPTDPHADASTFPSRKPVTSAPRSSPPTKLNSVESIRHRRAQSANIPSKLSNAIPAPLTPTVEETKTPGGTLTQPNSATGFFTTFFSAAQKAADQLGTSVGQTKSKPSTPQAIDEKGDEEVIPGTAGKPEGVIGETRQRAVETLGKGDLSLSHLGILDSQHASPMSSAVNLPQQQDAAQQSLQNGEEYRKAEEDAAQRAVSMAYEKPIAAVVSQAAGARPQSVASQDRLTLTGDQTPPRPGADDGLKRSGSVRSKVSGRKTRRHRASSATTGTGTTAGTTIAAGLQSSATGLSNMGAHGAGHRLTGFAVASSKRNKDFHQLFRSVPEDDYLIEDYSAALQRDILLHGRLYVSEGHICFSSNILGWVTNLVMSFDEVVSIEKKSTAVIFPNAIVIQTLHARNTFASFVARDSTYELLIGIWKISHPNLKSSLNGVTLDDAGTGDKTEVADPEGSDVDTASGSDDEVYDEDAEDDAGSFTDAGMLASAAGSDSGDLALSRKTSAAPLAGGAPQTNGVPPKVSEATEATVKEAAATSDFPGPHSHPPTECTDGLEHYDRPLLDTTIGAPLGKVYSLMFGSASGAFMRKWLVEDQKSRELNLNDDKIGLDNDHKTMTFDYIKPLNAPVGPKQTKCITTNTLVNYDLEKSITIDCSTQTPDVPSGNVFTTKTRYCFMWGPGNSTRIIANCTVEWTGKSWLKGPIEKGANDGQIEYAKSIVNAIKAAVTTTKAAAKGVGKKGKRKGKRDDTGDTGPLEKASVAAEQSAPDWGLFEPLHTLLGPIIAIVRPFLTSQVIIAVLFVMLVYTWLLPPYRSAGVGFPGIASPDRVAAYEELWRREESELWDWLEDRVGLDHLYAPSLDTKQRERQKVLSARSMGKKLEGERMSERQMDAAIEVTEERLSVLKDAVARDKAKRRPQ